MIDVATRAAVDEHSRSRRRCKFYSLNSRAVTGSNALGRARNRSEPSSSKLHRAKCRDGEQVTEDVRSLNAPKRGGRKGGLEQIPHLLGGSGCDAARIELFDRFKRGEALRGRVFHRIEIFIGKQGE